MNAVKAIEFVADGWYAVPHGKTSNNIEVIRELLY